MKKVFSLALLAIATLGFVNVKAQKKPLENSLLWEIKGNGLKQPSYLYGTHHLLCPDDYVMKDKTINAFKKSEQLVVEVNLSDTAEMNSFQRKMQQEEKISKLLTQEEQTKLDAALKQHFSASFQQVENLSKTMLSFIMVQKMIKCKDIKNPELEFIKWAGEQNKNIGQLETAAAQLEFLDKAFSASFLVTQFDQIATYGTVNDQLLNAYKTENLDALEKLFSNPVYMDKEAQKWMLTVRNNNWIKKMPSMMKEKSTFFAVGAGHLIGEEGVINLLRKQGYTVTAITK